MLHVMPCLELVFGSSPLGSYQVLVLQRMSTNFNHDTMLQTVGCESFNNPLYSKRRVLLEYERCVDFPEMIDSTLG
jgi:hypothetical protein